MHRWMWTLPMLLLLGAGQGPTAVGTTNAALRTAWVTIRNQLQAKGIIPVLLGEYPYRSNTTVTSLCDTGTQNCGKQGFDVMKSLFTNFDLD